MGGLDSRYMISQLKPADFKIKSLTTIATPHRGSSFADYMFDTIGPRQIRRIYKVIEYFGFETGAFSQLTLKYMRESFNPRTPDIGDVKYFSYGASLEPARWSVFAPSHAIVKREEGINDGLVRCVLLFTARDLVTDLHQCLFKSVGRVQRNVDRRQPSGSDQLDQPCEVVALGVDWKQEKVGYDCRLKARNVLTMLASTRLRCTLIYVVSAAAVSAILSHQEVATDHAFQTCLQKRICKIDTGCLAKNHNMRWQYHKRKDTSGSTELRPQYPVSKGE